jgi:SPP1 gp7 family putative phage head morphogenesis protein
VAARPKPESLRERSERQKREARENKRASGFHRGRRAELAYGQALRQFAQQIARLIEAFAPEGKTEQITPDRLAQINEALARYAHGVEPWAKATAWRMISETNRRDKLAWEHYTQGMSEALRREVRETPIGEHVQTLLGEQVRLITSMPREAGQWVHERSLASMEAGTRYQERTAIESGYDPETGVWKRAPPARTELVEKLAQANPEATEKWLRNRATLIARTETARAQSVLVQARSKHIGAELYYWQTAEDWKVRESHARLQKARTPYGLGIYKWDEPPLSDPPDYHSHPGQIFNCRCVALPIIPET